MLLFATALLFWTQHRQGGDLADSADINDGIDAVSEMSRIKPNGIERLTIISVYKEMIA